MAIFHGFLYVYQAGYVEKWLKQIWSHRIFWSHDVRGEAVAEARSHFFCVLTFHFIMDMLSTMVYGRYNYS